MQKIDRLRRDADDIQFRMSCGIAAVGAVHEVMESGASTAESYVDALYGAYDYLHMLNNELRRAIDAASGHDDPCDKEGA